MDAVLVLVSRWAAAEESNDPARIDAARVAAVHIGARLDGAR